MNNDITGAKSTEPASADPTPAKSNVISLVALKDRAREKAIVSYEEFAANDDNIDRLNQCMDIALSTIQLAFPDCKFADCDKAFLYEAAVAMIMRGKGATHPLHDVINDVYEQIQDQYSFDNDDNDQD
jgi:hypothetical protein